MHQPVRSWGSQTEGSLRTVHGFWLSSSVDRLCRVDLQMEFRSDVNPEAVIVMGRLFSRGKNSYCARYVPCNSHRLNEPPNFCQKRSADFREGIQHTAVVSQRSQNVPFFKNSSTFIYILTSLSSLVSYTIQVIGPCVQEQRRGFVG